ncbi:unnamed protein product [Cuscuta campestris]|uniref:POX domain-containing protein n=1 Tax=Cuscuta campestris TaxID=132261 RepID=A0A484MYA6_9ASTE|nr:unnamed protein product [Cuscuta campestris]
METRTHRPDLHVLQYLGDYPNCNLESTMDLAQLPTICHRYGNVSYEPSEMLNFGSNSPLVVSHRSDVMNVNQELSGSSSSRMDNNAFFISSTQNCGSWNVANPNIQSHMFVGGSYPGVLSPNNAPSLANNQSNEIHGQYTQKQFEDMQHEFTSSSAHYRSSSSSVQEVNNNNGDSHRWNGEFEGEPKPTNGPHIPNTQALSLSLSSVSPSRMNPRCVVPFGPFTGYATILRSSRFLKPAQQLLDELCSYSGHMGLITRTSEHSEKVWDEVNLSSDVVNAANTYCMGSSNEYHQRSENQQTRVKLLHMQEEVCRKYSQYRQQMQMVVSSFESVAGLSAATPYIFLALKATAGSFSSLHNAISDQLKNTCKAKGEDKLLSSIGKGKGDRASSSLKLVDHGVDKHGGSSMGFLDHQPHVWRPQRGLPERAVSVLRAWLFDHFLHPYPTDTDKHMLATQTGLSRNQARTLLI